MEIKTYFNGAVTQNQIMVIIVAIVVVLAILALAKKIIKVVLSVAVIVVTLVYLGITSPEQLKDVSSVVAEQGDKVITQISDTSKNVKFDKSSGDIQVCIEGKWINVKDISSYTKSFGGSSVSVNGKDYQVTDEGVKKILDLLVN